MAKKLSTQTTIQLLILVVGVTLAIGFAMYMTAYKPTINISPQLSPSFPKLIENFLKESLKSEYSPTSLIFTKKDRPEDNVAYSANWIVRNTPLSVSYNANRKIDFLTIAASSPTINISLTAESSSSLANRYFKNFQEDWKCTKVVNHSFCESVWIEKNGDKKSVFVFSPLGKLQPKTLVVYCLIPSDSGLYYRNSCVVREQP